jgi:hypothetical protein
MTTHPPEWVIMAPVSFTCLGGNRQGSGVFCDLLVSVLIEAVELEGLGGVVRSRRPSGMCW